MQDKKKRHNTTHRGHTQTPHDIDTAQHDTTHTQQVLRDNLFLHEASNSPTNEGPRPRTPALRVSVFLPKKLGGRVIIVIVIGREMKRERERDRERS